MLAARVMRQVLVDYGRRRGAAKRGGQIRRVTPEDALAEAGDGSPRVDAVDVADALAELEEREGRVLPRHAIPLAAKEASRIPRRAGP